MNPIKTGFIGLLAAAVPLLLVDPSLAQSPNPASVPVGCTGDYVCSDDPSVVATWPLERWETVRRVHRQAVARHGSHERLHGTTKQPPPAAFLH